MQIIQQFKTTTEAIKIIGPGIKAFASTSKYLLKGRQGNAIAAAKGYALKKTALFLDNTGFSVKAPTKLISGIVKIGKPLVKYIPALSAAILVNKVVTKKNYIWKFGEGRRNSYGSNISCSCCCSIGNSLFYGHSRILHIYRKV